MGAAGNCGWIFEFWHRVGMLGTGFKQPTVSVNYLCHLIKDLSLFSTSVINSLFVISSAFVVLSYFCHLLTLCYLLIVYVTYALYKYTSSTHKNTQLSFLRYLAHAFCANTLFQLNKNLWRSFHTDLGDRGMAGEFLIEHPDTLYALFENRHSQSNSS